jgi:hypothetical protein
MRPVTCAVGLLLLTAVAACSGFPPGSAAHPATPAPPSAGASGQIDACKVMTAADVQTALGVPVNQKPVSSPATGGGSVVGSCFYATPAQDASAGLVLLSGLPIDVVAVTGGYQPVSGVGDRAYINGFTLIGQKGKTTFEIVIAMSGSQAGQQQKLTALATVVAGRL